MKTATPDTPAFPTVTPQEGISLRDYFAGQALCGLVGLKGWAGETAAVMAYKHADDMLRLRENSKTKTNEN